MRNFHNKKNEMPQRCSLECVLKFRNNPKLGLDSTGLQMTPQKYKIVKFYLFIWIGQMNWLGKPRMKMEVVHRDHTFQPHTPMGSVVTWQKEDLLDNLLQIGLLLSMTAKDWVHQ